MVAGCLALCRCLDQIVRALQSAYPWPAPARLNRANARLGAGELRRPPPNAIVGPLQDRVDAIGSRHDESGCALAIETARMPDSVNLTPW
jgi:hypothetical protein